MNPDLGERFDFAIELAEHAGAAALRHFGQGVAVELKGDQSPVTIADREGEQLCRERIADRYPDDGILGEEFGATRPEATQRWILDPIDGTRSFVRGVPLFGVLIAFERDGRVEVGVMHFPALGETVAAARGHGATWNDAAARVSGVDTLAEALVLATDAESLVEHGHGEGWRRLSTAAGMSRTWGDCYGHALVATGRAECMLDPILAPWDVAPLQLIVEEAGGVFTGFSGRAETPLVSGIATNARLAEAVRDLLGAGLQP